MQTDPIFFIFEIAVLFMSAVAHEVAHGYTAYALGDPTAKYQGRLTMNPLKHIDMFGTIILPALLLLSGSGFIFGWAKPVPFNPYNLKNQRWGEALIAVAGPASNIFLAVLFSLVIRLGIYSGLASVNFITIAGMIVLINLILALFNLVPIPPLDGSKILFAILPAERFLKLRENLERFGMFAVLIFVIFFWGFFYPILTGLFTFLTGLPF